MARLNSMLKSLGWIAYAIWALTLVGLGIALMSRAHAEDFTDRWTTGTAPILTTPNVVTIAPQIAVNPQITITPNITINPPTVTVTGGTTTIQTPAAPKAAPPVTVPAPIKPQMLAPVPPPRAPPRIIVRRYIYENDYRPMTDLSVPADRVNRSDRPGCNGIACYP